MIYPPHIRPIKYINNTPYLIHAIIPIEKVRDGKAIKEWLGVDTMFKVRNTEFWFCNQIQDVEWEYV